MVKWRVIVGKCQEVVPTIPFKFHLVFADPPFNIGHPYRGYDDKIPDKDYQDFTYEWIAACWEACDGVICLHGPDDLAELYLRYAELQGFADSRIAWLNWHYRFGQCHRANWIDARCHCLVFSKNDKHTWNPEAVLVDSDRVAYGDKRVNDTENGGKRLPGTIWGIPSDGQFWGRVVGNSAERRPHHPNQLPEVYLERLIRAYTNPGDRVLDPFCGSGTTATVAVALGRHCVTIDVSESNAASARERIAAGAKRIK